jgi:hypothetical protein|nr:MAG TPA: hypothetical protein [Caudoviricetes sp.]
MVSTSSQIDLVSYRTILPRKMPRVFTERQIGHIGGNLGRRKIMAGNPK